MPVPSSIADLSSTASSNYPSGSESIGTSLDDYLRAHAAIIKQVSDAKADTSHTQASTTISDSTAAGRTLLTAADASAQRTALGLGTAATSASTAFAASGAITSSGLTQSTGKLIGRTTASTGAPEEITVGSGLSLSAGTLSASATGYPVVAWVKFDGTRNVTDTGASTNGNPVKIYASGNVSSVTKNATGDFTVNFSSSLADEHYCVSAFFRTTSVANLFVSRSRVAAPTSSAFRLDIYNSGVSPTDCEEVYLSFIR